MVEVREDACEDLQDLRLKLASESFIAPGVPNQVRSLVLCSVAPQSNGERNLTLGCGGRPVCEKGPHKGRRLARVQQGLFGPPVQRGGYGPIRILALEGHDALEADRSKMPTHTCGNPALHRIQQTPPQVVPNSQISLPVQLENAL